MVEGLEYIRALSLEQSRPEYFIAGPECKTKIVSIHNLAVPTKFGYDGIPQGFADLIWERYGAASGEQRPVQGNGCEISILREQWETILTCHAMWR